MSPHPLAPFLWLRAGGAVTRLVKAKTIHELQDCLTSGEPYFVLGNGSNLLVRDGVTPCTAIKLFSPFASIQREGNRLTVGAACLNTSLVHNCAAFGLSGLEFLAGIPGSMGGAIAMNAGAHGAETQDYLCEVTLLLPSGKTEVWSKTRIPMQYRKAELPEGSIVLSACFELKPESSQVVQANIDHALSVRNETQPVGVRTAGSTFKNPPGYKAWWLIDQVGLRGYRIGDAQFSPKHCNFMLNLGEATATDLEALGELARKRVYEQWGILLEWEIKIMGTKSTLRPQEALF